MFLLARRFALSFLIDASIPAFARAADFQAGVAVVDITPPLGYRMSGYFNERHNTGTHDPLTARPVWIPAKKTLVFSDIPNSKLMQWHRTGQIAGPLGLQARSGDRNGRTGC